MPKRVSVSALSKFARQQGLTQAILCAYDGDLTHVTTYGSNAENCASAARAGKHYKKLMGWPENLQADPPVVASLKNKIKNLEAQIEMLESRLNDDEDFYDK